MTDEETGPVSQKYIDVISLTKSPYPINTSYVIEEHLFIKIFHSPRFDRFMVFYYPTFELTNTEDHEMVA